MARGHILPPVSDKLFYLPTDLYGQGKEEDWLAYTTI